MMNAQLFKDIRKYLQMTQKEFADYLGITRASVAQIETNRNRISDNVASRLAKRFEITDEFMAYLKSKRQLEELIKRNIQQ